MFLDNDDAVYDDGSGYDDDDYDDNEDTTMTIKMMKMTMMRIQTHLLYDDKRRRRQGCGVIRRHDTTR